MKSKELFPAIFSRHAAEYERRLDQIMSRGEARSRQRVIDLLEVGPGMRVLDLACGPGTLSRRFAALVAPHGEVVGVDLAPGMIELARAANIAGASFYVMDIEQLDFPDSSFDAAACGHGLQFVPHLDRALGEARRVLIPGARFAASVPLPSTVIGPWKLIDEVVDKWLPPAPRATDQQETRATVADANAFQRAAVAAGFTTANVKVAEERVRWESAEQLVSLFASWWDCASRLEGIDLERRQAFVAEATAALRRRYPGRIETTGRNHVLLAVA